MHRSKKVSLIFLQGLGNSIINYPIYHAISMANQVEVITFKNGSSSFYSELGASVIEIGSIKDLMVKSYGINSSFAFCLYPNWRRELLAINLINSPNKYFFNTDNYLNNLFLGKQLERHEASHDFENNIKILDELSIQPSNYLESLQMKVRQNRRNKYIVIHPTASVTTKYYPKDFWIKLIKYLSEKFESIIILTGNNPIESSFVNELRTDKTTLAKSLPFSQIIELISGCEYFIGLDSSMLHLAALLQKKVYALWSFADIRRIYPYTPDANIYVPRELLKSKSHKYPREQLPYLERANAQTLIEIIEGRKEPDLIKTDKAKNKIKLTYF